MKPGDYRVRVDDVESASGKVLTRAEVRAELDQAYRDGLVGQNTEVPTQAQIVSGKSRAEVRNETIQSARRDRTDSTYFGS